MPIVPGQTATKTLFALSGNTCYYDGCEQVLTAPAWKRVKAHVAHIAGENPGSARYDPTMTDVQRAAFENLMLLCPNCHTLIDDLEPERHTAEWLLAMKERHESRAKDRKPWASDAELERAATIAIVMYRDRHHLALAAEHRQTATIETDTRASIDTNFRANVVDEDEAPRATVQGNQAVEDNTALSGAPTLHPPEVRQVSSTDTLEVGATETAEVKKAPPLDE